jgi:hypothetical protein
MTQDDTFETLKRTPLERLVREFFKILDKTEESESGATFHPTAISSCRTADLIEMNKILNEMKEYIK